MGGMKNNDKKLAGVAGHYPIFGRHRRLHTRASDPRGGGASYIDPSLPGPDGSASIPASRREQKMMTQNTDPVARWVQKHPWTIGYIAVVTTVLFVLEIIDVATTG